MKKWLTAFGIVTLTAIVCTLIVRMGGQPAAPAPQAAPSGVQVRRLPPSTVEAPRFAEDWSASSGSSSDDDDDSVAAPAPAPPAGPGPAVLRERISASFDVERIDSAWNGAERARLEKALPALLPQGSQLRRVECRSTMCRIESSHTGLPQFGNFVQRAFVSGDDRVAESGFFAGPLGEPEPGQPVITVTYLARKGHALPMPERLAATP